MHDLTPIIVENAATAGVTIGTVLGVLWRWIRRLEEKVEDSRVSQAVTAEKMKRMEQRLNGGGNPIPGRCLEHTMQIKELAKWTESHIATCPNRIARPGAEPASGG